MFCDDPEEYCDDDGDTDFPSGVGYLTECLEHLGAKVPVEQIHPLAGVIVGSPVGDNRCSQFCLHWPLGRDHHTITHRAERFLCVDHIAC